MKYKASDVEPILEYVFDFLIRKILRLIYRCKKVNIADEIVVRSLSNCFDSSNYPDDLHMGMEVSLSTEELVISARNYVITIIEFRQRLVGIFRIGNTKPLDSGERRNKIFALANDLFYACFLKELGVTDGDRQSLSNAIALVPHLILSLCRLVTFSIVDISSRVKKKIDIAAGIDKLKLHGDQRAFMLSAFHRELAPYADHVQQLLINNKI